MCGINGIFDFSNSYSNSKLKKSIHKMNKEIIHRGPDDDGFYYGLNIALGMRRLSIIDLENGKQPIISKNKDFIIIFNGEIYNYIELKNDLIKKNCTFETSSDTEVILNLYIEYGNKAFEKLRGMFAFCIYDKKCERITLVRDYSGEKPLHYYLDENIFIFGSELKSLMKSDFVKKEINQTALEQFLTLTYIPAPNTIYKNVYKIKAGCYMTIDKNGKINNSRYWDVEFKKDQTIQSFKKSSELLYDIVHNSVKQSMVSDVPVGTFLSGGIDSTIITGIVSKYYNKRLNTFTITFDDKRFDESDRARVVSKEFNTRHHELKLNPTILLNEMNTMINNLDEPFADASYIPTYLISKFAKKHVKVVLTGDAGDELFAGYNKYLINYYSKIYLKIPKFIRKNIINKIIYALPDKSNIMRKVRKVINNSEKPILEQRINMMTLGFKYNELNKILKKKSASDSLEFIKKTYNSQLR